MCIILFRYYEVLWSDGERLANLSVKYENKLFWLPLHNATLFGKDVH